MHLRALRHWNCGRSQTEKIENLNHLDCQDAPCTMCEENTYGYNAVTGCQECSCRTEGTNGDMSCRFESNKNNSKSFIVVQKLHISPLSLDSGQCNCADRVEGRQCDHCVWGAWNYPTCDPCDCDTKGTTEKICDQVKLAEFEQKYRNRNLCHCKMFRQHQNVSASPTWSQAGVTSARKASSTFRRPIPSAAWSASASVVPRSALHIQH